MVSAGLGEMLFCDARSGLALSFSAKARSSVCRRAPLVPGAMRYGRRYGIENCGSWQ